jgi:hypothetical protein
MNHEPKASAMLMELTETIVQVVPEIRKTRSTVGGCPKHRHCSPLCKQRIGIKVSQEDRSITLEDVLKSLGWLALERIQFVVPMRGKTFRFRRGEKFCDWLLGEPLSEQPAATIKFIHSLLCRTK